MKVFQSYPQSENTNNPYLAQLRARLDEADDVEIATFTWSTALLGRYDVVHLHWPEALFAASTMPRRARRDLLFALWVLRLFVTRTAIVRTVHNVGLPEGLPRHRVALLHLLDRLTTVRIRLNPVTPVPEGAPVVTIPHGHYRDWLRDVPRRDTVAGRIGYVGQVRRYKNVETLVAAFAEASTQADGLSLRVGGRPTSTGIEHAVRTAAAAVTGGEVRLDLRHLDEAELVEIVTEAELVVLPYRFMHNSGSVFYALSLERPVLVPDNEVNRALADEVGPGWVHLFAGELDGPAVVAALDALRATPPAAPPDLSGRHWSDSGDAHVATYRLAIGARR